MANWKILGRLSLAPVLAAAGCQDGFELPEPVEGGFGPPLVVTSPSFGDERPIPRKFSCDGEGVSPEIAWSEVPDGTQSIALVTDDEDAPGTVAVHWVAFNIPPEFAGLPENVGRSSDFVQGKRESGSLGYGPPCPPKINRKHNYVFRVFASDAVVDAPEGTTRDELYRELDFHVLALGELDGTYDRP